MGVEIGWETAKGKMACKMVWFSQGSLSLQFLYSTAMQAGSISNNQHH